ncbi:AraC family transcriptional regulator [Bacteroides uniformis]|jgi:AraC-like DNA-binding protein|uniref:AraC family transcriptional regulator n=1 Tax=Bacteroides uniformis TaxID=820 RepID=A0A414BE06_BACUN|nr:AraC family transcriptional regulator [Bacteroides uniformis]
MEPSIYSYSLCIALPLMLFFGFYFLLAQTPEKAIFENYLRSRRIMGMALLLLAANYSVHFFFGIRFKNVHAAILMNLSTYFLCYYLFSSALITLLDRFYITRKRIRTHFILWIIFSGLSGVVLLLFPDGIVQKSTLLALAAWLVVYGLVLSRRVIVAYRRAVRIFDDTHADDIGAYIKWLSFFTYWALIFGVGCGLFTFLPDEYVYIWILSSIPFYVYLYHCYQNYLLFYEQVENAMEDGMTSEEEDPCDTKLEQIQKQENPSYRSEMAEKINGWIDAEGYIQSGLTIKKLADMLQTNRTYLSEYIKTTYGASFRDWITGLRINYAKRLLAQYPRLTVADISERSGFLSPSHFIRLFKENSGCTPVKWRKTEAE